MQKYRAVLPIVTGLLLLIVCLSPVFQTRLFSDDLQNFQLHASAKHDADKSISALAAPEIETWKASGRFTPLSFYLQEYVFKTFRTVKNYKAYVFVVNVLAIISFFFVLYVLNYQKLIGLFCLFFAGEMQFRLKYGDAYTSLNGMYQVLCIYLFLSMALFVLYHKRNHVWMLVSSCVFFACACLISEEGLILVPVFYLRVH